MAPIRQTAWRKDVSGATHFDAAGAGPVIGIKGSSKLCAEEYSRISWDWPVLFRMAPIRQTAWRKDVSGATHFDAAGAGPVIGIKGSPGLGRRTG